MGGGAGCRAAGLLKTLLACVHHSIQTSNIHIHHTVQFYWLVGGGGGRAAGLLKTSLECVLHSDQQLYCERNTILCLYINYCF